jgi:hypothetical protein
LQQPRFPDGDVANTERVQTEHIFTADNELDYSSDIADSTTVTVSELPSNTVEITASVMLGDSGGNVYLGVATTSETTGVGDTEETWIQGYFADGGHHNLVAGDMQIHTDGNSFYVRNVKADYWLYFFIKNYKTKG